GAFVPLTRCCAMRRASYIRDCLGLDAWGTGALTCPARLRFHKGHHHQEHPHGGGAATYAGPKRRVVTIGVGGPVGSGKTALVEKLGGTFYPEFNLAVITNDIYTREDAEFLSRRQALPLDRIVGVETGGCPHSAIREDASVNLAAIAELEKKLDKL